MMKSRRFTSQDQVAFAELSGDYNPLHIDPVAARRLLYGAAVVHGIHCLLWALDAWLEKQKAHLRLRSLKCAFPKPLRVGDEAQLSFASAGAGPVRIEVLAGDSIVARIECQWDESEPSSDDKLDPRNPDKAQPQELSENQIEGRSGTLELRLNSEAASKLFPHLARCVPEAQIGVLLGTTRLVGMECPGLHSVFSELNLVAGGGHQQATMSYEVTKLDRRFGLVLMQVAAPGMTGVIKAFVRPAPQQQAGYADLKRLVTSGEFSGQQAIVIGGSRGLGEVTAKLLAAGGADVKISFHQGQAEAQRIVDEIKSNGGAADCFQFDVLSTQRNSLSTSLQQWRPTHLYYFATPFIFSGSRGAFSASLFHKFCDYYVSGFLNVVNSLKSAGVSKMFHPSSVAVDETPPDMAEYAAAKMAAEVLCKWLEKSSKGLSIYQPRLPRMGTDQTVSLLPVHNEDPAPIMLDHLRAFRGA